MCPTPSPSVYICLPPSPLTHSFSPHPQPPRPYPTKIQKIVVEHGATFFNDHIALRSLALQVYLSMCLCVCTYVCNVFQQSHCIEVTCSPGISIDVFVCVHVCVQRFFNNHIAWRSLTLKVCLWECLYVCVYVCVCMSECVCVCVERMCASRACVYGWKRG